MFFYQQPICQFSINCHICCGLLVPGAFVFLAIYAVILLAAILTQMDAGGRDLAIHLWALNTIPPELIIFPFIRDGARSFLAGLFLVAAITISYLTIKQIKNIQYRV